MGKLAWYKRYPSDFISGTMKLTLEERGAYSLVLDMIYDNGGPIADDPYWLASVMRCSVKKWEAIRSVLLKSDKLFVTDFTISNMRAEVELGKVARVSRVRASAGAKGGKARVTGSNSQANAIAIAQANASSLLKQLPSYTRATQNLQDSPLPPVCAAEPLPSSEADAPGPAASYGAMGRASPPASVAVAEGLSRRSAEQSVSDFQRRRALQNGRAA